MPDGKRNAPPPDLRIVPTASLLAHEVHDNQRAEPLIETLAQAQFMVNPVIVTPMHNKADMGYIVLDGANRHRAFEVLGYPHVLVQIVDYASGVVELDTWKHVVCGWDIEAFATQISEFADLTFDTVATQTPILLVISADHRTITINTETADAQKRSRLLRQVVDSYQKNARLYRSAGKQAEDIFPLYPDVMALMVFPAYQPADIIAAARERAYLPPGVSRHIIHGRALRVNYPLAALRDKDQSTEGKNAALQSWLTDKFTNRQVRYYAEATYQFDE